MSEIKLITITIEGETATGKTAVLASIRDMLTEKGYCVTSPDKGQVLNPSEVGDHNPMIKPEYVGRDYPLLDKVIWIIKEKAFKADSLAFEYQGTHVEKIYQQWHADLNDAIKQIKAIKAKYEVSE